MQYDFDLLTIGAGSGGVSCSRRAGSYGAKVAIVERSRADVGGTCVLRGCVPKKLLVLGSHFADLFKDAAGYGWTVHGSFDWATLQANKKAELERLNGIYNTMLDNSNVTVLAGHGQLVGPHTVAVDGKEYTAKHILIATGSRPHWPDLPGIGHSIVSDDALDLPELPRRLVVMGAGYIGIEFACLFHRLGVEVDVVFRRDYPLMHFDHECAAFLAGQMQQTGIRLHPGRTVTGIANGPDGKRVQLDNGTEIMGDVVLNATGRVPNVKGLGLEQVGVAQNAETGAVLIDPGLRTSVDSIFAVGDVTNQYNLTPFAIKQGRALADHLFLGKPVMVPEENIPTAIFSQPPMATVGLSQEQALTAFRAVDVYSTTFRPMLHTLPKREERTFMKTIVDPDTDRVLGVQMVGLDAPEIIQGFAVALTCGATKAQFDATVGIHPSSAEEFVTMTTRKTVRA